MPLTLPGLFDFTLGRSAALDQSGQRAANRQSEANAFISQLNALNTSLNTNDNLEFRRTFAEQPTSTPILERFQNLAAGTNNPFLLQQAVVQGQSLAPLLAQSALQNPFFGLQQGLPNTAQGALQQGLLGFNPIFQQQANQNVQALLALNNPNLDPVALGSTAAAAQQQGFQNQNTAVNQQLQRQMLERLSRIERAQRPARAPNTAAPPSLAAPPFSPPGFDFGAPSSFTNFGN